MKKLTPLDYAKMSCDAIMHKYAPEDLPPKNAFFYIQGVFLSGMQRVYLETGERKYFNYIKDYVDSVIGENGELRSIDREYNFENGMEYGNRHLQMLDCKQPSILLHNLYDETGEQRYINAIKTIAESMYYWPVNSVGGYWHMMTQIDQMWMDGAYMAGPLSVMYAKRFGAPIIRERAIDQILIMNKYMRDSKTGLYFHGWDESKQSPWADPETGLSAQIWGRAVGWYAVAILDVLDYIPKDHPKAEALKQIERDLLKSLSKYQHKETGMWCEVLDKPYEDGNWSESSATNLILYSYAKASRLGIVENDVYADIIKKGYDATISTTFMDEDGYLVVDKVCEGTCIDEGTYEHYINRRTRQNDLHGCGAFVLMCVEMEKYMNHKQ